MIFVGAMREVETSNVHPCPQKLLGHLYGSGSRTQRTHYFGLWNTPVIGQLLQDPFDVYVRHSSSLLHCYSFLCTCRSMDMSHETEINKTNNQTRQRKHKQTLDWDNTSLGLSRKVRLERVSISRSVVSIYLFIYFCTIETYVFLSSKQHPTRLTRFLCLLNLKVATSPPLSPTPTESQKQKHFCAFPQLNSTFLFLKITFVFINSYDVATAV